MKKVGIVAALGFVGTVWAANWAIEEYGPVAVGFGLAAPAGVYFAGLAFTLRDIVHRTLGRWVVVAAILAGAALSYAISDNASIPGGVTSIAIASGIAFLVSEICDLTVYEPVRRKGWLSAVVASNIVGIMVDSALFLYLAFGSFDFLKGQIVGKAWMTLAAVVVLALVSFARGRRDVAVA